MSDSDRITFQELCELSDLDVLGLLDEFDQPLFERGFNLATALEQDQIRERQAQLVTRLVGELGLADTEALPAELKQRVLDAVHSENQMLEASLAPLARIGRRRRERLQRMQDQPHASVLAVDSVLQLRQANRSAVIWRAASFALMASLLASLIAGVWISRDAQEANRLASQLSASQQLKERYDLDLDSIMHANAGQHVLGLSTEPRFNGAMAVRLDTEANAVDLLVFGMNPGDYAIQYTKNDVTKKIQFKIHERATVVQIDGSGIEDGLAKALASSRWSIIDSDGIVVARCNSMVTAT